MLRFEEEGTHKTRTHVVCTTWRAYPTFNDVFTIVCLKLQDLQNKVSGRVNFVGDTKPKLGTLEEHIDVYISSWVYKDALGQQRTRPIIGNFHGGCATHREAVALCNDVWKVRARYRSSLIRAPGLPQ